MQWVCAMAKGPGGWGRDGRAPVSCRFLRHTPRPANIAASLTETTTGCPHITCDGLSHCTRYFLEMHNFDPLETELRVGATDMDTTTCYPYLLRAAIRVLKCAQFTNKIPLSTYLALL